MTSGILRKETWIMLHDKFKHLWLEKHHFILVCKSKHMFVLCLCRISHGMMGMVMMWLGSSPCAFITVVDSKAAISVVSGHSDGGEISRETKKEHVTTWVMGQTGFSRRIQLLLVHNAKMIFIERDTPHQSWRKGQQLARACSNLSMGEHEWRKSPLTWIKQNVIVQFRL